MKKRLLFTIERVIKLLDDCGLICQVDWFKHRMSAVEASEDSLSGLRPHAEELRSILAGMGSLTDLSLEPSTDCGMSDNEANEMKWKLADELDEITGEILQ